jgi:hypothetical protein
LLLLAVRLVDSLAIDQVVAVRVVFYTMLQNPSPLAFHTRSQSVQVEVLYLME